MPKVQQPEVFNRTGFTLESVRALPLLGRAVSKWRQRNIELYQHPTDENLVVSVGTTFDGKMMVVADDETKDSWATALEYAGRGKVYVSD